MRAARASGACLRFPSVSQAASPPAQTDLFGESTLGNLHFSEGMPAALPGDVLSQLLGLAAPGDIAGASYAGLAEATQAVLSGLEVPPTTYPDSRPQRAIFCSRTLNLRSIQVIGYDMDYTLIHYDVNAWEGKAYAYGLQSLRELGCPVEGLRFDPDLVIRCAAAAGWSRVRSAAVGHPSVAWPQPSA